jgi:hypothetical protein
MLILGGIYGIMCAMKKEIIILVTLLLLALGSGCASFREDREWGRPVGGLSASIEVLQASFVIGEPIHINVMVRNLSGKPVSLFEDFPFFYEFWVRKPSGEAVPAPIDKYAFALYARKRWSHRLGGSLSPRYEDMAPGHTHRDILEYRFCEPIPPGSRILVCVTPLAESNINGKFYSNEVLMSAETKECASAPDKCIMPTTNAGIQAYYAKHKSWLLKPKRTGTVETTYGKVVIVVNLGADRVVEEGDEFIIFKGSRYKGTAKAVKVFPGKSLCMVLHTSKDEIIAVGDEVTTKLSE